MASMFRHRLCAAFLCMTSIPLGGAAHAAAFPDQPIQLVSPYTEGGTNDYLARLLAKPLGEVLHGSVVVQNRPGTDGIAGADYVARSRPDGYTLLMGSSATHGTDPALYPRVPYDAVHDFAPISMIGSVPIVLVVNKALGINSIKDLLAYGAAHPGALAFGSSGIGSTGHLTGEAFKLAAHLNMSHTPYKGDAPAITDTMDGRVPMSFVGVAVASPLLQTGKIVILAAATDHRINFLPDVPTFAEAGFSGLEFAQWYALFARSGTPRPIINQLNLAVKQSLARDDIRRSMAAWGASPNYTTPEWLAQFSALEIQRFGEIIHMLNLTADVNLAAEK